MAIDTALNAKPSMEKSHRMCKVALASSLALLFGLACNPAQALSLGRLTVQSALGEPLRAEIDIPDINADEADSLKGSVASIESFSAAGLEYNPAIANLQISLQRRADGRAFLRLVSERVVNDPFVDLVLEARWSSGRIVRDYTMLFDPPNLRVSSTPAAPTTAQINTNPQPASATPARAPTPNEPPPTATALKPAPAPVAAAAAPAKATPAIAAGGKAASKLTVRSGDTALKIARANKPVEVSLDQMLVAMLRANPEAFVSNNLNRLKAGAVLNLPSSDQAAEMSKQEAARTVMAQSKDFGAFRRQLAKAAPGVASNERQGQGKVQTQVDVKKPIAAAPDKLTLTKPAAQAKAAEDKIAAERQAKEAAARAAELERNVAELNRLKAAAAAASAAAAAKPAAPAPVASQAPAVVPAVVALPTPAVVAPAASKPVAAASAKPPVAKASAPKPRPVEEPSFLDDVLNEPLLPIGGGVLVLVLAGAAWLVARKRKAQTPADSSFLDSHLQPDSFFGASGGEQVDTSNESVATGSSMIYSPSQLDTSGDVDPVAEADVYLAYGRDQQAEEILKDALQLNPSRIAIHAKLADIYHKRNDSSAFNVLAASAYAACQGQGPEWQHIRDLGRTLDSDNILYQTDAPSPLAAPAPAAAAAKAAAPAVAAPQAAQAPSPEAANVDLDFDLDFDLDQGANLGASPDSLIGILHESDANQESEPIALYEAPRDLPSAAPPQLEMPADLGAPAAPPKIKSHTAVAATATPLPSFDLSAVSLDLGDAKSQALDAAREEADSDTLDPLSTKLALAREFLSIGDADGAHALAEEVYTQATGQLRADAKKFLTELGFAQSGFASSTF